MRFRPMLSVTMLIAPALLVGCGYEAEPTSSVPPVPAPTTATSGTTGTGATTAEADKTKSPAQDETGSSDESGDEFSDDSVEGGTLALRLNLNTATEAEFMTIPEVTHRMCHEFEEYRPYISIEQFRREMSKYVEDDLIAGYEKYVYVPIAFDDCDAETLLQLPGMTDEIAAGLMEERPFESRDVFLDALGAYLGSEELELAAHYLVD